MIKVTLTKQEWSSVQTWVESMSRKEYDDAPRGGGSPRGPLRTLRGPHHGRAARDALP